MVKTDGRRGASATGCLVSFLVLAVVLFYGVNLGRVWWRYFEIKDRMRTAARYARTETSDQVLHQLQADVLDVGLPAEAARFTITQVDHPPSITIATEYREQIDLPLLKRTITFRPTVTQKFSQ